MNFPSLIRVGSGVYMSLYRPWMAQRGASREAGEVGCDADQYHLEGDSLRACTSDVVTLLNLQ